MNVIDMVLDGSKLGFGAALGFIIAYEGARLLGRALLAAWERYVLRAVRVAWVMLSTWGWSFVTPAQGDLWQVQRPSSWAPDGLVVHIMAVVRKFDGVRGETVEVRFSRHDPSTNVESVSLSDWREFQSRFNLMRVRQRVDPQEWFA